LQNVVKLCLPLGESANILGYEINVNGDAAKKVSYVIKGK